MVAGVVHFVEFSAGALERAVDDQHQLALKGFEQHAVTAVLFQEWRELLPAYDNDLKNRPQRGTQW
jgi:hypothetical protein